MRTLILFVIGVFMYIPACGQSSCDKLYESAVKYQKTMTIASQNKAIMLFKKAQVCYDSDAKKNLCAKQIAICEKNKETIPKPNPDIAKYNEAGNQLYSIAKKYQEMDSVESQNAAISNFKEAKISFGKAKNKARVDDCDRQISLCEAKIDSIINAIPVEPVELTLSTNRLNFKRKPKNDMQTIRVNCNYSDWRVEHELSWITVFLSDHEQSFAVKAEQNPDKDSRFGYIYVVCGDKKVAVEVLQDGKKGLSLLIHNAKKNANL